MDAISRREFIGAAAMAGVALAGSVKSALAADTPAWIENFRHRRAYSPVRPDPPGVLGLYGFAGLSSTGQTLAALDVQRAGQARGRRGREHGGIEQLDRRQPLVHRN